MSKEAFISRHQSREQAFIILFEKCFNDATIEEIIENAEAAREFSPGEFALELINGVEANIEAIDTCITDHLKGWSKHRISKTALCLLRIAVFEILFSSSVPVSVAINEAVELAKEYSPEKDAQFINGLLGSVSKSLSERSNNE